MAGNVARMWEKRGISRSSLEKSEESKPLCDSGLDGEDDVKRDLKETGWVGVDWIDLAQDSGQT